MNLLSRTEGAGFTISLVFFQLFLNGILMFGAFANNEPRWGVGFLLSWLLVLLVGMGTCGQQL